MLFQRFPDSFFVRLFGVWEVRVGPLRPR